MPTKLRIKITSNPQDAPYILEVFDGMAKAETVMGRTGFKVFDLNMLTGTRPTVTFCLESEKEGIFFQRAFDALAASVSSTGIVLSGHDDIEEWDPITEANSRLSLQASVRDIKAQPT